MESTSSPYWRKCSSCKKPISFNATYWVCNVSTCNHKRTGSVFCNETCWDAHLPIMNHREAWCIERKAPSSAQAPDPSPSAGPELLVVTTKVKEYIRDMSGMSTASEALEEMSALIRKECLAGIESARQAERKTVMGRDIRSWSELPYASSADTGSTSPRNGTSSQEGVIRKSGGAIIRRRKSD